MVGETLNHFIQRIRLEKAALRLVSNPGVSITEIALDSGFSGSATFARAFRDMFGMSATEWRNRGTTPDSKIGKVERNGGKALPRPVMYVDPATRNTTWRITMNTTEIQIEVKDLEPKHVAYVRHIGPYAGDGALFGRLFNKLAMWAGPRGLLRFPETQMMSVYHDDPKVTDESKLRMEVCVTVPEDTVGEGEIGTMILPGGKTAIGRFELAESEYTEAWETIFGGWLPESGYVPDDRPSFEVYHNDPKDHPEGKCIVDICVPVKPM
jgi:AraC family transcriptional regulator